MLLENVTHIRRPPDVKLADTLGDLCTMRGASGLHACYCTQLVLLSGSLMLLQCVIILRTTLPSVEIVECV